MLFALLFTLQAHATPGLAKLPGTYVSNEGRRFTLSVTGNRATLRTDAELSRYGLCSAPNSLVTTNLDHAENFAEARFSYAQSGCSRIDGPVVFHYNKAFTGVDVYLVDVTVRSPHGRDRGLTMRWHLRKEP